MDSYLLDFQRDLNEKRLQVPTIFELIEQHGHLRDAVSNLFWFRGTVEHEVSLPMGFHLLLAEPATSIRAPHLMFMGDFINTPLTRGQKLSARGGMLRRYGFHDETTADYLLQLAETEGLPDSTWGCFRNNDFDSHTEDFRSPREFQRAVPNAALFANSRTASPTSIRGKPRRTGRVQ